MTTARSKDFIPIVDLFAGPGGLGEGFSSVEGDPFKILISAEMDEWARATLRLRAFYRLLGRRGGNLLDTYYDYCNSGTGYNFDIVPKTDVISALWREAGEEARQLTLGNPDHDKILNGVIHEHHLGQDKPWVLIGGPPCQAYSLVGRARNRGKANYKPEEDHRHFLYREYLKIIRDFRPAVFVMENVKGILSSEVGKQQIFHGILRDLADPDSAVLSGSAPARSRGEGYRIYSLVTRTCFDRRESSPEDIDARDFIICSERYGIPQARHRVILLGVREDLEITPDQLQPATQRSVANAIWSLPPLRSRLTKEKDDSKRWAEVINGHFRELCRKAKARRDYAGLAAELARHAGHVPPDMTAGGLRLPRNANFGKLPAELLRWHEQDSHAGMELDELLRDDRLDVWLNHETKGHMSADLLRYAYASAFAQSEKRSPKGHTEFDLEGLRPNHENWESGKFADRFRVQVADARATTVTSHISKDGHYFIHPSPAQCRSLTVREAARLQTFKDNYFFQGPRTQQYHQVGNAVPPMLARQIGEVVHAMLRQLSSHGSRKRPAKAKVAAGQN